MLLVIDNYDSFTYNLVQFLGELGADLQVFRNDKINMEEIKALAPERVLISPGPCTPKEAGISVETVKLLAGKIPLLGVCLGHQSLAYAFGGEIVRADKLMHGKTSMIHHDGKFYLKLLKDLIKLSIIRNVHYSCSSSSIITIHLPITWSNF